MLRVKRTIAARVARCGLLPGSAAAGDFLVRNMQMNAAGRDVDFDLVAGLDESKRTADETFGSHMKNAGAVAGAAHARVGNAQHIAHALFYELFWYRQHAPIPAYRGRPLDRRF